MAEPFSIVIITGSPTRPSRSAGLAEHVNQRLAREGFSIRTLHVRDLPAQGLLHADFNDPAIVAASELVAKADGVVIASPVYKAAYTGVLKAFIDLLPQFALRDKVVLPLLTGGTIAHVLALDYGLRPVLQSLDPKLVVGGLFVLDKSIVLQEDGSAQLDAEVVPRLEQVTRNFIDGLRCIHSL
jgi:FMN reductase